MSFLHAATVTLILSLISVPSNAQRNQPTGVRLHSASETTLNKPNLDKIRKFIVERGHTCTYNNMYSSQPCLETEQFDYYLRPDLDPKQWRMRCAPQGDCNTLVIHERLANTDHYRTIRFKDKQTVMLDLYPGENFRGSKLAGRRIRAFPEQAVRALLTLIEQQEKLAGQDRGVAVSARTPDLK